MNVEFKYISFCLNIILFNFGSNSHPVTSTRYGRLTAGSSRLKRQDGYVYDRPTVSFDLPTATSVASTQAPTVDRMQMYYAYPVPSGGGSGTVGQQNIASSGGANAASSGASGYNYEVQNTQTGSQGNTLTQTQNTVQTSGYNYGVQNSQTGSQSNTLTQTQNTGQAGGYNYEVQNAPTGSQGNTLTETQNTATGYQSTAVTGTQTVVSSGSAGYSADRPTPEFNTGVSAGSVSTSAPRYLPPQVSSDSSGGVSVTTNTQAQTGSRVTQTSDTYIPPSTQVSSQQNSQTTTITQSGNVPTSLANVPAPNTGYLAPSSAPQQTPISSSNAITSTSTGQTQSRPVQSVPNQQYLPPIETSISSRPVNTPASTYLPPVF